MRTERSNRWLNVALLLALAAALYLNFSYQDEELQQYNKAIRQPATSAAIGNGSISAR